MFLILWEYTVKPEKVAAFKEMYGPAGSWARLFESADGYISTTLSKKLGADNVYLTEDRWESETQFRRFVKESEVEYKRLDSIGDELTESEVWIGEYVV